jgi:deoxyribonuclease V
MDSFDLFKEQQRLAPRIQLNDGFTSVKKIAGIDTFAPDKHTLLAQVVVCEFPSFKIIEQKSYTLHDPLLYRPGFSAYREMPAMIEAYNLLDEEPDVIIVKGEGILHPRRIGLASHLGLILNKPTIGVLASLPYGKVEKGKIFFNQEICGFEVITREHANPVYISPGHLVTLGSALNLISKSIKFPHKLPEPLHLAHKLRKRMNKQKREITC